MCELERYHIIIPYQQNLHSYCTSKTFKTAKDDLLRKEQARFWKRRSCTDHIFTLWHIFEKTQERKCQIYIAFIDFEKVFDSLHRISLWKVLRSYGVSLKWVDIVESLHENFECRVWTNEWMNWILIFLIHNNKLTEVFEIKTDVKQGCILSPILFSLAIDWIMNSILGNKRTEIQ